MLLIGSKAWELNLGCYLGRAAKDLDIICTKAEFYALIARLKWESFYAILKIKIQGNHGEIHVKADKVVIIEASFTDVDGYLTTSNNQLLYNLKDNDFLASRYVTELGWVDVPTDYILLALKESHKYKGGVHFQKTRKDILTMRGDVVCGTKPEWIKAWQQAREKATLKKAPVLNQNKSTFFNENVPYLYDHDTIHEAVKHLYKPAYRYYMQDNAEVMSDKTKFESCSDIVKLYGVLEEAYVLALERAVIPHQTEHKKAFDIALEKVCTTITSGFFREYAWENYDNVQKLYHDSYVNKFQSALEQGKIEKYNRR
jgi:hypothetical protein